MRQVFALVWLLAEAAITFGFLASATPANPAASDWVIAGIMVAVIAAVPATMVAALAAWVVLMLRFLAPK